MSKFVTSGLLAAAVLIGGIVSSSARAEVILTSQDADVGFVGPTEGSFTISEGDGVASTSGYYTGSTYQAFWTITATDGGSFVWLGLDTYAIGTGDFANRVDIKATATTADGSSLTGFFDPGTQVMPTYGDDFSGVALTSLTFQSFGFIDGLPLTSAFSDVTLSEVPEPATMLVLGTGLFGLGLVRRRR